MSKNKPVKKKVVVTTTETTAPVKARTTAKSPRKPAADAQPTELIFHRGNYLLIAGAAGLVILGTALMAGGHMPDPNTWDDNLIYSPLRITVAPLLMLAGLALGVVAIFRK